MGREASEPLDPLLLSAIEANVAALDSDGEQRGSGRTPPTHPSSSTSLRRKEKKRRVSTACLECRRRKSKCDGKSPCSGCQAKGLSCTMLFDDRRRKQSFMPSSIAPESNDVQALKERCRYLERLMMASSRDEANSRRDERSSSASASGSGPASQMDGGSNNRLATPSVQSPAMEHQQASVAQAPSSSHANLTSNPTANNQPHRSPAFDAVTIPFFDFGTNDASYHQSDPPSSAMSGSWLAQQSVRDSANSLHALSSTLNISNLSSWPSNVPSGSAAQTAFPQQPATLPSGSTESSSRNAPPNLPVYSGGSDASASPAHQTRSIYVPPAQSLTEEDMLEPMPRTALDTIHAGKATPSGVDAGSLAHQLTRRDGRMTLADGGRLRWYGATSSRSLSYGGLHFQHRGRKQIRDLNATCRMALNKAGYTPDSIFEEYGFQQRIVS